VYNLRKLIRSPEVQGVFASLSKHSCLDLNDISCICKVLDAYFAGCIRIYCDTATGSEALSSTNNSFLQFTIFSQLTTESVGSQFQHKGKKFKNRAESPLPEADNH